MAWGDNQDYEEAEFNLAAGTIYRIDEALRELNYFFKIKQYYRAYETLKIIYSEVYPLLTPTEIKQMDEREKEIDQVVVGCYRTTKKGTQFVPTIKVDQTLRIWDRQLRLLMAKHRLYMKMADTRLAAAKSG